MLSSKLITLRRHLTHFLQAEWPSEYIRGVVVFLIRVVYSKFQGLDWEANWVSAVSVGVPVIKACSILIRNMIRKALKCKIRTVLELPNNHFFGGKNPQENYEAP